MFRVSLSVAALHSLTSSLSFTTFAFSTTASIDAREFSGGCALLSVHLLLTNYLQLLMLATNWQVPRLLESEQSKPNLGDFQDRPVSLPKISTNSVKHTDVTGGTYELHYHHLRCGYCGEVRVFALSLSFSFWKHFNPFRIDCSRSRCASVTCLASSSLFPPRFIGVLFKLPSLF